MNLLGLVGIAVGNPLLFLADQAPKVHRVSLPIRLLPTCVVHCFPQRRCLYKTHIFGKQVEVWRPDTRRLALVEHTQWCKGSSFNCSVFSAAKPAYKIWPWVFFPWIGLKFLDLRLRFFGLLLKRDRLLVSALYKFMGTVFHLLCIEWKCLADYEHRLAWSPRAKRPPQSVIIHVFVQSRRVLMGKNHTHVPFGFCQKYFAINPLTLQNCREHSLTAENK